MLKPMYHIEISNKLFDRLVLKATKYKIHLRCIYKKCSTKSLQLKNVRFSILCHFLNDRLSKSSSTLEFEDITILLVRSRYS